MDGNGAGIHGTGIGGAVQPGLSGSNDPLDRLLVERGLVTSARLDALKGLLPQSAEPRVVLISRVGLVEERQVADALGELIGDRPLAAEDYPEAAVTDIALPVRFLATAMAVPVADDGAELVLAMADPRDAETLRAIALKTARIVRGRLGLPGHIEQAIERCYGERRSRMDQIVEDLASDQPGDATDDVAELRNMASEAPVIRLVNLVLQRAVDARASDIHIEPFESGLALRLRIDGVLHEEEAPPSGLAAAVTSRIKIMARMDIAERRLPQDGRIRVRIQGKDLDIRVSSVPTIHGESLVLRLLDKGGAALDLGQLGFSGTLLDGVLTLLRRPHGILLVSGPTGSGKTTTLYAALQRLNAIERKILTVEDPVEYEMPGINQIQVKPAIGLGFAEALRSIVRQDPDVIMVGEMRDLETARIAVQSALTGHMVLSTVHTNNATASITRLLDMGLEDYLLTSAINGIVAQRLVRRLCVACREPYVPDASLLARIDAAAAPANGGVVHRARGCPACSHTGYQGRAVIAELLVLDDAIHPLILARADANAIRARARSQGMRTLFEDGVGKAFEGVTSLEEVFRVTQDA